MRITRVYTRAGDRGTTHLVGGHSVRKDHPRIEAYGTVDELNACVGLARAAVQDLGENLNVLDAMLAEVQQDLFNVGSDLATRPDDRWEGMYRVGQDEGKRLEAWCDQLNADLGPLKEFILPGGGRAGSALHLCRVVARRAERRVVTLAADEPSEADECIVYLNRLSDFLFIASRWCAKQSKQEEVVWKNPNRD